jgi:hypothetical protein
MKNTQKIFLLVGTFISSFSQICNPSTPPPAQPPSALLAATTNQQTVLEQFNKGNDDHTEEAAHLALLLIANGPVRKAEVERETHTQTCTDGKQLMVIGGIIFTLGQSLNLITLPPTSYFTRERDNFSIVSTALGSVALAAGFAQYHIGKWRLNKMRKNK